MELLNSPYPPPPQGSTGPSEPPRAAMRQRGPDPPQCGSAGSARLGPPRGPAPRQPPLPRPGSDSRPPSGRDGSARAIFPGTTPPPQTSLILISPLHPARHSSHRRCSEHYTKLRNSAARSRRYHPANRPAAASPPSTVLPRAPGPSPLPCTPQFPPAHSRPRP